MNSSLSLKLRYLIPLACLGAGVCLADTATTPASPAPAPAPTHEFRVHLLPPGAYERLNLTPDQAKAVAILETQASASLLSILTPDQIGQLKQMHPPHGGRPNGQGGPGRDGTPPPPPAN